MCSNVASLYIVSFVSLSLSLSPTLLLSSSSLCIALRISWPVLLVPSNPTHHPFSILLFCFTSVLGQELFRAFATPNIAYCTKLNERIEGYAEKEVFEYRGNAWIMIFDMLYEDNRLWHPNAWNNNHRILTHSTDERKKSKKKWVNYYYVWYWNQLVSKVLFNNTLVFPLFFLLFLLLCYTHHKWCYKSIDVMQHDAKQQ